MEQIEVASSSSRPALELPKVSPSRVAFLPPASCLKELHGTSDDVGVSDVSSVPQGSNGIRASEETNIDNSTSGLFGRFSLLSRSRSAVPSAK
ncbi:hypothetical protein AAHA92_18427 [Salvia divinorum]|uniref:Uncharacterized protein n=1 Tax=Salvia divinorum TaxID=28513 RepID=A0ABD1H2J1_SALDI